MGRYSRFWPAVSHCGCDGDEFPPPVAAVRQSVGRAQGARSTGVTASPGRWRPAVGLALAAGLACGPARSAPATSLYVDCRGAPTTAPTVILEAGAFGASADWDLVLDDLAKGGRVCAYDRAGVGRSPPRAGGEDVVAIADELSGLLDALGETRPVILVGHSNGALYIETFAALWPGRVAGLVYVNGVGSDDLDDPRLMAELAKERRLSDLAVAAAHLGLTRLMASAVVQYVGLHGTAAARKQQDLTRIAGLRTARDEDRAIIAGLALTRALGGSPPEVPTVAIIGAVQPDAPAAKAWRAAEAAPARRASASWILDTPGATHVSFLARDRAYVTAAVDWLRSLPRADAVQAPQPGR